MRRKNEKTVSSKSPLRFGKELSFAASEAYKLLRTNLLFSMPAEDNKGRTVGITSSVRGEGKSTTSVNLAYALAESGKKVVLVECDMRLPTLARRLEIAPSPGLSNLIVGMSAAKDVLRSSGIHTNLYVIPAGDVPPNPSELLGSDRMRLAIHSLKEDFDFVLVDLPPVTAVSDALVAAELVDGLIVVVRQDVCTRGALIDTMRQLKVVNEKLLGFVFTCARAEGRSYYRKRSYGYRRYGGYGYEYGRPRQEDTDKTV